MELRERFRGEWATRFAIEGSPYCLEITRDYWWASRIALVEVTSSRQTEQGLEEAVRTHGVVAVHSVTAGPYAWAQDHLAALVAGAETPAVVEGFEAVLRGIADGARAAGFQTTSLPNENALSETIARALRSLADDAPLDSAIEWYTKHHEIRAEAFGRRHDVHFHVGNAVWDDDWVFHVACELMKQDVDPFRSLVVLVCADPDEYYRMMPDETKLAWLGAVSGDIVHFVWMTDRHGKPSLATKLAVLDELGAAGTRPPDDALLLLLITMRKGADGTVEADLQGAIPVLGRLDTEQSRALFAAIVEEVKRGKTSGDGVDEIAKNLRREIAAMRTLQRSHVLDWLKRVLGKFFPARD